MAQHPLPHHSGLELLKVRPICLNAPLRLSWALITTHAATALRPFPTFDWQTLVTFFSPGLLLRSCLQAGVVLIPWWPMRAVQCSLLAGAVPGGGAGRLMGQAEKKWLRPARNFALPMTRSPSVDVPTDPTPAAAMRRHTIRYIVVGASATGLLISAPLQTSVCCWLRQTRKTTTTGSD
jgi:hypothetical protein